MATYVAKEHRLPVVEPARGDDYDPDWREKAACLGADTGLFFAEGDTGDEGQRAALAYCARCPVRASCLEWALTTRTMYGVFGGTVEQQRQPMIRARWQEHRKRQTAQRAASAAARPDTVRVWHR